MWNQADGNLLGEKGCLVKSWYERGGEGERMKLRLPKNKNKKREQD